VPSLVFSSRDVTGALSFSGVKSISSTSSIAVGYPSFLTRARFCWRAQAPKVLVALSSRRVCNPAKRMAALSLGHRSEALAINSSVLQIVASEAARPVLAFSDPGNPFPWEVVKHYASRREIHMMSRLPHVQDKYDEWSRSIRADFQSIDDWLLSVVFNISLERCPESGKLKAVRDSPAVNQAAYAFRKNDFPYNVEQGIHHNVLWTLQETSDDELRNIIEKHYDSSKVEYVFAVNRPQHRTVKTIYHAHVFSRERP